MMVGRSPFSVAIPLVAVLIGGPAAAQDQAAAEAMFKVGLDNMQAGELEAACPALAESQRLDPRPGTLFALADCHERAGKIATAVAVYDDYLRAFGQMSQAHKLRHKDRARIATERKAALAAEIPELTLSLSPYAPKGVMITRDGIEFTEASLGIGLPLDPGEHVLTTTVGSGPVHEQRITLARGEKKTVELEVKEPAEVPVEAPPPAVATRPPSLSSEQAPAPLVAPAARPGASTGEGGGMSGRRIGALVAGGIGVAGLALGGVTGGIALSKKSVIEEHCQGNICDAEGKAAADASKLPGLLSTIGFGIGAAGIAAGAVLWLTDSSGSAGTGQVKRGVRATVDAGPAGAALRLKGVW